MVDGDGVVGEGVILKVFDIKGSQFHNIIPNSNTRVVSLRCLQDKSDLCGQFNNMISENNS